MKYVVSKKAFTIIELLVAMSLVVILMALSSLIFATGVQAHRTADSTIEIVRRAESISRQLTADVAAMQPDAPLAIWFEQVDTGTRCDQILFFADGNFQAIRRYNNQPLRGNLSRIYYGHAWQVNTDAQANPVSFIANYRQSRLFSRRAHLLTSDTTVGDTGINNRAEYDQLSLAEWKNLMQSEQNRDQVLLRSFYNSGDIDSDGRPMIDMKNVDTLHLLLSEQISEFKVQWAYTSDDLLIPPGEAQYFVGVRWWPDGVGQGPGVFFNMVKGGGASSMGWKPVEDYLANTNHAPKHFPAGFFPRAFKFTYTVHDVKGLFPEGRTFTQIVYRNN